MSTVTIFFNGIELDIIGTYEPAVPAANLALANVWEEACPARFEIERVYVVKTGTDIKDIFEGLIWQSRKGTSPVFNVLDLFELRAIQKMEERND